MQYCRKCDELVWSKTHQYDHKPDISVSTYPCENPACRDYDGELKNASCKVSTSGYTMYLCTSCSVVVDMMNGNAERIHIKLRYPEDIKYCEHCDQEIQVGGLLSDATY